MYVEFFSPPMVGYAPAFWFFETRFAGPLLNLSPRVTIYYEIRVYFNTQLPICHIYPLFFGTVEAVFDFSRSGEFFLNSECAY